MYKICRFVAIVSSLFAVVAASGDVKTHGKIVAFSGLSGSGKSTMANILSQELGVVAVSEPEESEWPKVIIERGIYGASTAMLEFRQIWAQMFINANLLASDNRVVLIDTNSFKFKSA